MSTTEVSTWRCSRRGSCRRASWPDAFRARAWNVNRAIPPSWDPLACRDPHRDDVFVVRVRRLPDGGLAIEKDQFPEPAERTPAPIAHATLAVLRPSRSATLQLSPSAPCSSATE